MRLAKKGYYGGDPDAVWQAPVDTVFEILGYETFCIEYEETSRCLNASE